MVATGSSITLVTSWSHSNHAGQHSWEHSIAHQPPRASNTLCTAQPHSQMMRPEAAGSAATFLVILSFDLWLVPSCLTTREYFSAGVSLGSGAIRLHRTGRQPAVVEQFSGWMGTNTCSRHGESGVPGESWGPREPRAILSLQADRTGPVPWLLGP